MTFAIENDGLQMNNLDSDVRGQCSVEVLLQEHSGSMETDLQVDLAQENNAFRRTILDNTHVNFCFHFLEYSICYVSPLNGLRFQ